MPSDVIPVAGSSDGSHCQRTWDSCVFIAQRQGSAGQGRVARWLALTGTGQRRRGYSACGVPIKITRTTYVASWKVDCCAVYPKTWWPGNARGLSNDWVVLPILLLCRNEPFTLAGK
jgi:hypothetical protein